MSNVIQLFPSKIEEPEEEDLKHPYWRCWCGSRDFIFYWDGEIECSSCGLLQEGHDQFLT